MPRLTNDLYYQRHRFLKKAWQDFDSLYAILTVSDQWLVHAYYVPSKNLTPEELLVHREGISKEQPSLPQAASKPFTKMYTTFRVAFRYAEGDELQFRRILRHFAQPGSYVEKTFPKTRGRHEESVLRIYSQALAEPDLLAWPGP